MKKIIFSILFFSAIGQAQTKTSLVEQKINTTLDAWHKAAADAKFDTYFDLMTSDAVFIGTDATENWYKKEFEIYAKPHFDKGKAWSFTALERHVYIDKSGKTAWFDELLNTQMKICRGSGVLVKVGKEWKIKHYVLSMTIPNDNSKEVIKVKTPIEDQQIKDLKGK
ncbi:nuclear transport factor 2 family protein [Flavobacterium sp. K5-23]|uniref:nuclear transport factor 2 family protein n=1 Tax=Flavobacterium sp. K5-23 TaxID=2746225 RepID=UPI00200C5EEE|nr:nuclear transport factor 2 family protein [Flavobacterium sp. K5-23]UQD55799.1 nuclear transport factor 2 family protein [Flavobacterium sp. K5-23]